MVSLLRRKKAGRRERLQFLSHLSEEGRLSRFRKPEDILLPAVIAYIDDTPFLSSGTKRRKRPFPESGF
jgi:hypothetical protein